MLRQEYLEQGQSLHSQVFGKNAVWCASAPGRVNLIGEHTDYNDGYVLPMALDLRTFVFASRNNEKMIAITSSDRPDDSISIHFDQISNKEQSPHWSDYVRGVLALYMEKGAPIFPINISIISQVPIGAGLSSSAALEIATAIVLEQMIGTSALKMDRIGIAMLAQKAEHEFCGVPCGIMDQFISANASDSHALLLDCRNLQSSLVSLKDPNISILIVDSNVKHALCDGEYSVRRQQCEAAVQMMQEIDPNIQSLRDANLDLLISANIPQPLYNRAYHVISENSRTLQFVQQLDSCSYAEAGEIMYASHASLRDLYEVSCPELDSIVDSLKAIDGVYGARMTGGGFGGSCVSLVETERIQSIMEGVSVKYRERFGIEASIKSTNACEGGIMERL